MYSDIIASKINDLFTDLGEKSCKIVDLSDDSKKLSEEIYSLVSMELSIRSKSILSDLLYLASKKYLSNMDPKDIMTQNKFLSLNLTTVLLEQFKFQLPERTGFNSNNNKRYIVDLGVLLGLSVISGGLVKSLTDSSFIGGYIVITTVSSLVATVLLDQFIVKNKLEKQELKKAISIYLSNLREQFINHLDCAENEFYRRIDAFESSIESHEV